jgi:IPT/TIG domain
MVDGYGQQNWHFGIGSSVYPLATGTGNSILYDGDNTTYRLLEFYSGILQLNLGARWTQDTQACGMINANFPNIIDGQIVGNAIAYPPNPTLMQSSYMFPLLSVYRVGERNLQFTTTKILIEGEYRITFVLPPLSTPDMYNALYTYLEEATRTIAFYNFSGSDPKFNNGELVFKEANIDFAITEGSKFGNFLSPDEKTFYPAFMMTMKVYEQNHFVPEDYIQLAGIDGYITNVDGYELNNPYANTSFNTINNLQFAIFSTSQTSGPIAGGQLVVLTGNGFSTAGITQNIQITFAGNMVQSYQINSDNLMVVYTAPAQAGSGPIVITDQNGNTAVSTQTYTYS